MGISVKSLLFCLAASCFVICGGGLPTRRLQQVRAGAEDLAAFRRAGCDNFTNDQWQPLRPGYHITVPYGWLNDPHGLFQRNGTTHMFFQYNPRALAWGAPFWGHVVSQDLVHWTWLPPALLPDQPYDRGGVWSGSATIDNEGVPVLTYTAAGSSVPEYGNFFQQQAAAVPEDLSDPLLQRWRKLGSNPFLTQVPPGGTNFQFRDPTEAKDAVWTALTSPQNPEPLPKSHYALAVGSQAFCMGGAGVYTAANLSGPWSYVGTLFNQLEFEPEINGQCMASRIGSSSSNSWRSPAYGGPCDQFGALCRMWEVVDFLELEPGLFMIKWDDQSRFRDVFSMEWYVLGNGPWDYSALHPTQPGATVSAAAAAAAVDPALHTEGSSSSSKLPRKAKMPSERAGSADISSSSSSNSSQAFGRQYSGYPGLWHAESAASSARPMDTAAAAAAADAGFNTIESGVVAARRSLFTGQLDGHRFMPQRTDYGSVYASNILRAADSRQLMVSWVQDTAAGCADSCSDQLPPVISRMGFKGVQTLMRQLSYDKATKTLRAYPVREMELLRGAQLYNASAGTVARLPDLTTVVPVGITLPTPANASSNSGSSSSTSNSSNSNSTVGDSMAQSSFPVSANSTSRQLEVQLNITLVPSTRIDTLSKGSSSNISTESSRGNATRRTGSHHSSSSSNISSNSSVDNGTSAAAASSARAETGPALHPDEFAVGIRLLLSNPGDGENKYVDIYLKGAVAQLPAHASPSITGLTLWVDRSNAGPSSNTTFVEGGPVPLPVETADAWLLPDQQLQLSLWVDHSIIEVFGMGGLARVTSRVYPDDDDVAWGVSSWVKLPTQLQLLGKSVSSQDADSSSSSGGTAEHGTFWQGLYCWWCKLWHNKCGCQCEGDDTQDPRCAARSSSRRSRTAEVQQQQQQQQQQGSTTEVEVTWGVTADGAVWEVQNGWLPPSC